MDRETLIGRLVYSKAGRDKGKPYIIAEILDEEYILLSDGNLRTLERPKKKKLMHVNISKKIFTNQSIDNLNIKKFIQSYDKNEEV